MLRHTLTLLMAALALLVTACEPRTYEECSADIDAMREVVEDAVDEAASCEVDSDCIIMDVSNNCEARCPVAVHKDELESVSQDVRDGELNYCTGYGEDCGFTSVTCEARYPVCNVGRCEMQAYE